MREWATSRGFLERRCQERKRERDGTHSCLCAIAELIETQTLDCQPLRKRLIEIIQGLDSSPVRLGDDDSPDRDRPTIGCQANIEGLQADGRTDCRCGVDECSL